MKKKYIGHLIRTKGLLGIFSRFRQIVFRFGITSKKIENCLDTFIDITNDLSYKPTLCVTAVLFERYPKMIKKLNNTRAELAFHGYVHTDYKFLSIEEINQHFLKAKEVFREHKTPVFGFRFPYLSWDDRVLRAIEKKGFLWSSNQVICWNVLDSEKILKKHWANYQRVLENLYIVKDSSNYLSLPRNNNAGFIEIPISVPDDEIIIDRLNIYNSKKIYQIWDKILDKSYKRGELFTLQTHHERVPYFKDALKSILINVKDLRPRVWSASLKEIAEWWKEKNDFRFKIVTMKNNQFHIKASCSERATILIKKSNTCDSNGSLFNNYQIINDKDFIVNSNKKPFIGIAQHCPQKLRDFLMEEGFMVEICSDSDNHNNYAVYLEDWQDFNPEDEKKVLDIIEESPFPVVRFWRWPNKSQSAFAVTGDIDGITISDFFRRYSYF